jgi:hypothetical protein
LAGEVQLVQQELEQQRSLPQSKADPAGVDRGVYARRGATIDNFVSVDRASSMRRI